MPPTNTSPQMSGFRLSFATAAQKLKQCASAVASMMTSQVRSADLWASSGYLAAPSGNQRCAGPDGS